MRILILTSKLNFETAGGSVIDVHLKARGLTERGHSVTVVTLFSLGNNVTIKLPYRLREKYVSRRGLIGIQIAAYRIICSYEKDFDIIYVDGHTFLYSAGMYRLLGGRVPVVGFFGLQLNAWTGALENIGTINWFKKIKARIRLFIEHSLGVFVANHIDTFVFSTPMIQKMYNDFGIGRGRGYVVENFVTTEELSRRYEIKLEGRTETRSKNNQITLFTSGRMIPEKSFNLFIEAFSRLAHKEKYRAVIAGSGPEFTGLKNLAHHLNLDSFIDFPGWVSKGTLYSYLNSATIFIFTGGRAEYGSVLLTEAMAFALPSIVPSGGALEWLADLSALTFKPNDPTDLARCIELLSKDTKLQAEISKKMLTRSRELDYKNLTKKLEAILAELYNRR